MMLRGDDVDGRDPKVAGSDRRLWQAAAAAAAMWVVSGAVSSLMSWNSILSSSVGGVLPATIPLSVWTQPQPWPVMAAVIGAALIAASYLVLARFLLGTGRRSADFVLVWFAAVAAGGLVGVAADFAASAQAFPPARLRWLLDGLGTNATVGAYWGLVQGWLPALVVVGIRQNVSGDSTSRGSAPGAGRRVSIGVLSGLLLVLLVYGAVQVVGQRAARTEAVQAEAIADGFDEDSGALPDPYAAGAPVPTVAPDARTAEPDWCTPDQATLLLGDRDAATGHRSLSITLMNFSEGPCVVDGYPDIAFADQNGNALAVELTEGGSFMTTDPGAQRVEIPPGGSAITFLGWDANPTEGALVASTLHAAPFAGETRGSWPVQTDLTDGAPVAVTAWQLSPASAAVMP